MQPVSIWWPLGLVTLGVLMIAIGTALAAPRRSQALALTAVALGLNAALLTVIDLATTT